MAQFDKEATRQAIAHALRVTRQDKGFSQEEAARAMGVHQPTVSAWENAKRTPDAVDLANAASTYAVDPSEFYAALTPPKDALAEAEMALNRAREIVRNERRRSRPEEKK